MPHALIADDNPLNLSALEQLLKREGVTVTAVESPAKINEVLDNAPPVDIVFLDLEFPNYNGLELVGNLRADARFANVPIIACTVHISEQNEARDAGFDGFIGKPLDVSRFPEQLRRILNGESVWEVSQ